MALTGQSQRYPERARAPALPNLRIRASPDQYGAQRRG